MKSYKILSTAVLALSACFTFTSCDSFLDEDPDNRATIDTEDKVVALLTSAYSSSGYTVINEMMSDNTDDMGPRYVQYDDRFISQAYHWQDITESDNDGVLNIWRGAYSAISSANHAIVAIEELGGPNTTKLKECLGEALICRAYYHFVLVNEFCLAYNPATSSKDLGIPYITEPET